MAFVVIALSGLLGLLALKSILPLNEPLFCLATGFFGISTLIDSVMKKPVIKKQVGGKFFVENERVGKNTLLAIAGAFIVSLMPSIGASQAAFIVRKIVGKIKASDYLILLGGVNTGNMILSFIMLFAWGKTRTGSAAAISQVINFGFGQLLLVLAACLIGLGFGAIATDLIASKAMRLVQSLDYRKINLLVLAFVAGLVVVFSGILGLAFSITAAAIGLVALNKGIKRTNSMAFLMVPTILHYLALA